jgi:filamentous hemagglutinin
VFRYRTVAVNQKTQGCQSMNRQLYRVIFNAARGMRMVVQETATATGKASNKATTVAGGALAGAAAFAPMLIGAALAGMLSATPAHAQIVGAPNVPGNLRPTVLVAPNGVPYVNIQTPSAAGVSRNVYNQFNIGTNGAILNNSRANVQSQLGGYIQGNPFLATGPARIIVNEVNGGNPSQIRGYLEVAGQRAEIIIANPAGISVDGGGFINASKATLTTGTPQFNAVGGLDSFLVRGGTVTIDGAGLDARTTDYAAILARAVQLNAAIYATDLKVVTGANQISADHTQITPTTGTGAAPTFALDVAALGGMYSGKIVLVGTEQGLGVRNAGNIGASAGSLVVTAAGRLENTGTLEGQSVQLASTGGDIVNQGTIRQTSMASLTLAAPTISNASGGWIGPELAPAPTAGTGSGSTGTGSTASTGSTGTTTASSGGTTTAGISAPAPAPIEPGSISAAGAIRNDGGKVYAGGPITVQTANLVNNGGTLSVASMSLNQPSFQNSGGALNVSGAFTANLGTFSNNAGTLHAGSLDVTTSGDFDNQDGVLTSDSSANLTVGGNANNTRGVISATGALTANVTGAIQNTSGTLTSNQNLAVTGQSLNNNQGTTSSASGNVQLNMGQQLLNTAGRIASSGTLAIQTGSLDGAGGNLQSTGDMSVTATQALTSTGTNVAGGNATFKGASVDLSGSQTGAANIAIEATQGNVTTSGATVATPGTLAITANAQPGQTLVNSAGQLNAAQLQINVSNIANTNSGEIIQTGTGATVLAVSGSIDNSNSHIATNGQDLTLQATSITNTSGKIAHAGTGTLSIAGGSFDGASGKITSNGALAVNLMGAFNQDNGTTYAKQVDIKAGSLSNQSGGSIVQADSGTTTLNIGGALANNGGTIASNGAITANAGSLANRGGKLQAAGSSDLNLAITNSLDNSAAGQILAGGNATVQAGSLKNDAGNLTAVGNLKATVSGAATNVGGTLASNGNTAFVAASLDNSAGTTAAVNGNLAVTTTGTTTNTGGTLQAGGATTLSNGGLSSASGKVFGNSLSIDTHGGALDNSAKGTVAATTTVDIKSGALNNDTGLVQSSGAMAINTNGQALTNTNAAGYTSGQGGITSADTLTLNAGAVNNSAGFIGAKGALTANTQSLSNTAGGQVVGLAAVSINTDGTTYDNSGGQTRAVGALTVNAGTIQNSGGLLRSSDTTTLNASTVGNTNTSGANQGIEGSNVAINATNLGNQNGAVRAAQNLTVTGGGTIDNSSAGLLSAGDTLKLVDPNAANPSAKTLNVVNTGGTLTATNSLQIDAAKFSNDGTFASGRDMSVALTQGIVNNRDVSVSGNLTYGTTGNLTNNAKLLAGTTLTVNGNVVDNTATGEMSGINTVVNAGTLNNRGLIDSQGNTQVNAGTLNNIGTGRLYGNAVSISAGTVLNDTETVGGTTTAATIASRGDLDIGVSNLTNREHALIFSSSNMAIGGALDANRKATGQGGTLDNLSADIQSLGDMSISMANVNNRDVHIQLGTSTSVSSVMVGVAPVTPVGSGVGRTTQYTLAEVNLDPANGLVYRKDTGELVGIGGYGVWTNNITTVTDTAVNADPAHLIAGGNMTVNGHLYNQDSQVLAGGTITANDYQSSQLTGSVNVSGLASVVNNQGQVQAVNVPLVVAPQSIALGAYKYQPNLNAATGYNAGSATKGSGSATGGGVSGASGGSSTGIIVEVAANVSTVVGTGGTGAGASDGISAGSTQTVPTVVRTSTPNLNVPQASLFRTQAGGNYLIETDPRFANYRNWLSSDYLLNSFGLDPNNTLKRLGDGFYEQKLIREQVAQLTGYRYLDGVNNDEDQYAALMNAGVTFAKQYGLRPGVALTAAQMAQLTSDIVWLVEQTVTLPDGSTQRVLVPQVYVRVRPGDIDGSGALLSADATVIKSTGDLVNTGTIAGRSLVKIDAENVNNLGGRIVGGSIGINARNDINNIGGSITADNAVLLTAGRDINVQTTTQSASNGNTAIDRIAGVYVTNPGGVLIASAGRDTSLIGAALVSAGSVAVGAGRNINMGTVTEGYTISFANKNGAGISSESREVGSVIQGQDNVRLTAGNDLNIRAGAVASLDGVLVASARNNINVTSGEATTSVTAATQKSSKSLFKKSSSSTFDSTTTTDVLSSSLSGKSVALVAGNDINLQAAQLRADDAMSLSAGRDINLTTANRTTQELHAAQSRSSGTVFGQLAAGATFAGDATAVALAGNKKSSNHASASIETQAIGTSISAGSLQTVSGRDTTLQGATVVADNDITMVAGHNLTIESAQNTRAESSYDANGKSGMVGQWYNPAIGNVKGSQATATTSTTQQASQVASLQGNVTLVAGNDYRQTASSIMAAGQAGPLVGGDVNILAKNVVINEAYNTTQSVTLDKNSSTIVGGSASFAGVSTDTLKGASSTIKAMGNTGDGRMQALGAVNLAMSGKQAYDAAQAIGGTGQLSYGVSVNVSRNTSQSQSFTNSSEAMGSSVVGANNVNIVATGGGKGSNISAIGSTIAAGNTVNLAADNDVTLEASRNTSLTAGRNESHGSNVGVTFGAGAQNGFSIQLGVSNGKGKNDQNDVSYNATQVSGGKAVNISSGGDLNMRGATVEANRVTADVGGNLNIESLQDISVGQTRQSSSGFNVSLCIPPICYGAVATASGSAAGAKANGVFVSPAVQSGIKAGDGGFDVNVGGNTTLKGAVIESTQAAIDNKKNNFSTGGALTMSDLQNVSQSSGSSYSVSGGLSLGYTTKADATPSWAPKEGQSAVPPNGSAGVGSYSGNNQTSVTKSGISGIAGDQSVRTGDKTSAGTLIKDWNTQTIVKDVQAQAQLTQQFNQNASREIGTYAGNQTRKYETAQATVKTAQDVLNDPAASDQAKSAAQTQLNAARQTMATEQTTYDHWKEGGDYRVALHTAAGALGGGVARALGAGASAALMPRVGVAIGEMGLPAPVAQALGAVTAAAIGGVAGGAAGAASGYSADINNRQLHFSEAQKLSALKVGKTAEQRDRLDAAACALVHCADGIPPSDPNYAKLQRMQEDGAKYTAEQSALKATGEFVYSPVLDGARDALTRNGEVVTRAGGAANLAGGSVGLVGGGVIAVGGAASCAETLGLGCAAVPLGAYIASASNAQAQDGSKTLFGPYQSSEGQRVLDSFNVAGYPGEHDPLMEVGIDASKFGFAWLGGKYIPKALAKAEGLNPVPGVPKTVTNATCSFRGDMMVKTTSGYTQIKDIHVGDGVYARDERDGAVGYKTVLAQYSNPYQETVYLTIKDERGRQQTIVSNKIHPFFTIPEGDAPPQASEGHSYSGEVKGGRWVDAANLRAGFKLLASDGKWQIVVSARVADEPLRAYNMTVADYHTYFVKGAQGDEGVWVHNNCWENLPSGALATGKTTADGRPIYTFQDASGNQVTAYQGWGTDTRWYNPSTYAPTAPAGTALPPPRMTVNNQGITEIAPGATPLVRQGELNVPDLGGSTKLRPAEAAAAAQVEPVVGTLKRYDGPPTFGNKSPDLQFASGENAGKTVDLMYTTGGGRPAEIAGMNRFFEKNMTVPEGPGLPPPGVGQIQEHFKKADIVMMDFRILTPQNQQILQNYINTLPSAQAAKIMIIK